jgi:cell pole-organizing protein PopZ
MTQPAKVQEPSMEEILASIRRIIADDEAKPVAEAPRPEPPRVVPPAPKPSAMTDIPPSAIPAAQAAAAKTVVPAPAPPPPPPPESEPNSQDDIDAMLASLDAATTEEEVRPALPDGDVFELTDEMVVPEPEPAFQHVEPEDDLEFAETAPPPPPERPSLRFDPPSYNPPSYDQPATPQPQMLSHHTVSAVESAFNSLANTVLSNNARTLEDLVKEMLRPMLKSWLDDNLPGLVERIVKSEIERVSRGGR